MEVKNEKQSSQEAVTSYKAVTRKKGFGAGKQSVALILLLAACFTAGLGGGYVGSQFNSFSTLDRSTVSDGNAIVSKNEKDISAVASKVGPSVVSIITKGVTQSYLGTQTQEGAGSGIIISKDGYILTNKHVISGSDQLSVITSDGTVYDKAHVVGTDPLNDLAFIKLDGVSNLTPATLGDSSSVRIGQNVVAIGNSLGQYQNTVTSGIISGTGRPVSASDGSSVENLTDLIQTDAAINPGNSGGPLVNLSGQVVGVNTAVAQNAQSIGFSIPINSAKGIIKNLEKTGKIERGYLGVNYITITPEVAKHYNLSVKKGAYVNSDSGPSVISGSPADKAGIKDKDIITKVGDIEVGQQGSLGSLISEYGSGETVPLTVLRNGKTLSLNVTLETYPSSTND
ncbi:MAG: trypsin-like peptidase domain-containing protein [Candidatus Nomurabacteria bacterium]|nr:MAG: trypsin-like peptidase domain-containing protein [Candidatus Nomurabacteria bacterium]